MEKTHISADHIKKLDHPVREIRNRSLLSLLSKQNCGIGFDNDLLRNKELLFYLFKWFRYDDPDHQQEVLETIFKILTSPFGEMLIKHYGCNILLQDLESIRNNLDSKYGDTLNDIINYVKGMKVITNENIEIPKLNMPKSIGSNLSENNDSPMKNLNEILTFQKDTSINFYSLMDIDDFMFQSLISNGVKIFLMPWCHLNTSDLEKISNNEDCFNIDISGERPIYFFSNVLLRDFPPEVFLNRPTIIKCLLKMINESECSIVALEALLFFCSSLSARIQQLQDATLRNCKKILKDDSDLYSDENGFINRQNIKISKINRYLDTSISTLKQMPLPFFCLDAMYSLVRMIGHTSSQVISGNSSIPYNGKEINLAFALIFKLLKQLQCIITNAIWRATQCNKFVQEVLQKIVILYHICGDVLGKLRVSCLLNPQTESLYRISYLRLLSFSINFAIWCESPAIMPHNFITSLYHSINDAPFSISFPKLHTKLLDFIKSQNDGNKNLEDQCKLKTYFAIYEICKSMSFAIDILQNYEVISESPDIIYKIKDSLSCLEFHKNIKFISFVLDTFSLKIHKWKLEDSHWECMKYITLELLAHSCVWIRKTFYSGVHSITHNLLGGIISQNSNKKLHEMSLKFILDSSVLLEISSYGLESETVEISNCAKGIIQHLIRGKLLLSESLWRSLLEALLPVLPILHSHTEHDNEFGSAVIKTLDLKIGECMLIPKIELIKGNIRLLFSKCMSAQVEGSKNLIKCLHLEEACHNMLPKKESIVPDVLWSAIRSVKVKTFSINKITDQNFYEEGALLQIMNLLKINPDMSIKTNEIRKDSPQIDPSICKSAFAQMAVILHQRNLHDFFVKNGGCEIIMHNLKMSLTINEYSTFPEVAISCISILNSICCCNISILHWASEQNLLLLYLIRTLLLFPNEENFISTVSQLLCLLVYSHFIINSTGKENENKDIHISMHYSIVKRVNLPFKCNLHSQYSAYRTDEKKEFLMGQPLASSYFRIYWYVKWHGDIKNVVKWPYVPDDCDENKFSKSLKLTEEDLTVMKVTCSVQGCVFALYGIQNATSHTLVNKSLDILTSYIQLAYESDFNLSDLFELPWCNTLRRFLITPPASSKDTELLYHVIQFFNYFLKIFKNGQNLSIISWIVESVFECSHGISSILFNVEDDSYTDILSFKLKNSICQLVSRCNQILCENSHEVDTKLSSISSNRVVMTASLIDCLLHSSVKNIYSLAYIDHIVECLVHLTSSHIDLEDTKLFQLTDYLINVCNKFYTRKQVIEYKGYFLLLNALTIMCHILNVIFKKDYNNKRYIYTWVGKDENSVLLLCMTHFDSFHAMLRAASVKILSGIVKSDIFISYILNESNNVRSITKIAIDVLSDVFEASFVRQQASMLLCNLMHTQYSLLKVAEFCDIIKETKLLYDSNFFDSIIATFTNVCVHEKEEIFPGDNIPLSYLSNKDQCEVAYSKKVISCIPLKALDKSSPKCSIKLLVALSDVLHNLFLLFEDSLNFIKPEVFKILFRCILLKVPTNSSKIYMMTSICKTLYRVVDMSNEIHLILVNTKDCMSALLDLLIIANDLNINHLDSAEFRKWSLFLIGSLLGSPQGFKCIWNILCDGSMIPFFHCFLITINDEILNHNYDLIPSSLYCLVSLFNSYMSYYSDTHDINLETFLDQSNKSNFDNSIYFNVDKNVLFETKLKSVEKNMEFVFGEIFCVYLIWLYRKNNKSSIHNRTKEPNFDMVSSGLCNLLALSKKSRLIAINDGFLKEIVENLCEIQYVLMTDTSQVNLLKNKKKSTILHYFNWTVLLICNIICDCSLGKEMSVEFNIFLPIHKLWPWIVSNNLLRFHVIQMLCIYTNLNPRGAQSMCVSIGTRSLLMEIIDLIMKEMNMVARKHPLTIMDGCLQILQNVCPHIHCRTIIIKSELFNCLNKLHPAITKRQVQWKKVEVLWERFLNVLTRYSEGQMKVAEYLGNLCALIHQADGLMITVLRNCTFNPLNRPRILGSAEVINIFSNILSSESPIVHKMAVCSALWAICANSQKSKLSVKTMGLTGRLMDCLQILKCMPKENEREIQIITYILKVINVT